jgi:hypothetical protein
MANGIKLKKGELMFKDKLLILTLLISTQLGSCYEVTVINLSDEEIRVDINTAGLKSCDYKNEIIPPFQENSWHYHGACCGVCTNWIRVTPKGKAGIKTNINSCSNVKLLVGKGTDGKFQIEHHDLSASIKEFFVGLGYTHKIANLTPYKVEVDATYHSTACKNNHLALDSGKTKSWKAGLCMLSGVNAWIYTPAGKIKAKTGYSSTYTGAGSWAVYGPSEDDDGKEIYEVTRY